MCCHWPLLSTMVLLAHFMKDSFIYVSGKVTGRGEEHYTKRETEKERELPSVGSLSEWPLELGLGKVKLGIQNSIEA